MFEATIKKDTQAARDALRNPRVGDRYTEMFAFWLYVVGVVGETIITMEASPPCTLPDDGEIKIQTRDELERRLAYGSIDGYWVRLVDRGNNVDGWLEAHGFEIKKAMK